MQYRQKLDDIEARFEELTGQMADNEVISDSERYRKVAKSHSELSEIVAKYREWKKSNANADEARLMLDEADPELRKMAADELAAMEPQLAWRGLLWKRLWRRSSRRKRLSNRGLRDRGSVSADPLHGVGDAAAGPLPFAHPRSPKKRAPFAAPESLWGEERQ